MSPQLSRLKRRPEFLRVAGSGEKWVAPGLILQVRRTKPEEQSSARAALRVGFTVSRKVGNAVERNRVKRRLRALAREILPVQVQTSADLVLIGRRAALTRPFAKLRQDLLAGLKKLKLIAPGELKPS